MWCTLASYLMQGPGIPAGAMVGATTNTQEVADRAKGIELSCACSVVDFVQEVITDCYL